MNVKVLGRWVNHGYQCMLWSMNCQRLEGITPHVRIENSLVWLVRLRAESLTKISQSLYLAYSRGEKLTGSIILNTPFVYNVRTPVKNLKEKINDEFYKKK